MTATGNELDHPILVVVRGMPGSGKSYMAAQLLQSLGTDQAILLDPDAIDFQSDEYSRHTKALTAEGVDPKLHAYRFLRAQAYEGIAKHKIIIWDQPFTNLEMFNKMIDRLQTHATECHTQLPILIVEVEISPSVAKSRVAQRKVEGGHGPSDNTLTQRIHEYRSFATEDFNTLSLQGESKVSESVNAVMRAINDLR